MKQLHSLSDPATASMHVFDATVAEAHAEADRGDPRIGRQAAERALVEARRLGDPVRVARALGVIVNASRALADYARAATAGAEAVSVLAATPNGALRAAARVDAALVQFDLGDYPGALAVLARARSELVAHPDASVGARCDHFEGMIHSRLGDFESARAAFERALAARRQAGDDGALAATLNSLGVVELREAQSAERSTDEARGGFDRTIARCSEARDLAQRAGDARLALIAEINIAGALGGLGRHREALARFLGLLDAMRGAGDRHDESLILANAGEAARLAGEIAHARTLCAQAVECAIASGSKAREQHACLELSRACEASGDCANALAHYKRHHQLERETRAADAQQQARLQVLREEVDVARGEADRLRSVSSDLVRENRELERQVREDALTGLANRRALDEALVNALAASRFAGTPLSLVVFDIDRFKSINDRLGHALGDAVLRRVGTTLRSHCRTGDVAARLGGEEFVLLLAGTACEQARAIAERVREEIALADWGALAAGLVVTVSAGVAGDPGQGSAASLLRLADEALYRAKDQGRDRVCVA